MSTPPRCEVVPLPSREVSLRVEGVERTRWHASESAPRPFFYPLLGPSGETLTRMGHPGAPNHDHHLSVWFAHHKLLGIDFWSNQSTARIRQTEWLVYDDGNEQGLMAVRLGWFDGHDPQPLVEQELIAALRPFDGGEYGLELQSTFRPKADAVEFQQTNFGFLAVRVAKGISVHFGGGQLRGSEGQTGEPALFGRRARWMDYSGPVAVTREGKRIAVTEGITYFDHPTNPGHPTKWHVREDGWMGASVCFDGPVATTKDSPLKLRYLLHVHSGEVDQARADELFRDWQTWPALQVIKSRRPHRQYEVVPV